MNELTSMVLSKFTLQYHFRFAETKDIPEVSKLKATMMNYPQYD